MQLIFCQKGEPIDTILLVFAKFGLDWYRNLVFFHLATVEELRKELTLFVSTFQQLGRKTFGVR